MLPKKWKKNRLLHIGKNKEGRIMEELYAGLKIRDRYVLKKHLGSGSFGDVWMAEDKLLGMDIAIKLYIRLDDRGVKEFSDEFQITSGMHHDNLLVVRYFDIWNNRPFLIMEYCPNGATDRRTKQMSEKEIWQFIRDVSLGLSYLHNRDFIHQDIKPENILINENGHYLISDFGISKKMRSTMRKHSVTKSMDSEKGLSGSVPYLAPECFIESKHVKASDIWALGASIYELITGILPFMGMGGQVQTEQTKKPILPAGWSKDLERLVQACLAYNAWDRPKADDLVKLADKHLRQQGTDSRKTDDRDSNHNSSAEDNVQQNIANSEGTIKIGHNHMKDNGKILTPHSRHGFVSFFLKAGLVVSLLASVSSMFTGFTVASYNSGESASPIILSLIFALNAWGYLLMLQWNKLGFWMIFANSLFLSLLTCLSSCTFLVAILLSAISLAISISIFRAILGLKKDGKSAWEQLESNPEFLKEKVHKGALAVIACAAIVMIGYAMLNVESSFEKEAKSKLNEYYQVVEECRGLIGKGSSRDTDALLQAKDYLYKIVQMEATYSSVNKQYKCSAELKPLLEGKLTQAHDDWVNMAYEQYTKYHDKEGAIQFYKKALLLKENKKVREWVEKNEN